MINLQTNCILNYGSIFKIFWNYTWHFSLQVPLNVTEIITTNHPVKIGVSDAFYVDATVSG